MKNNLTLQTIHILLVVIGIGLMIGGIITGKHGATIIGLIISSVNAQQSIRWSKKKKNNN